jgi:hypothetical protein
MGVILPENITIGLPIYVRLNKAQKERFSLNLNTYRNAHFHTLNKAKSLFEEIVAKRINHLPQMVGTELTYSLFFGSKRHIDIANICCIVDKFFCDTLVNQKKLIDDNMDVISKVTYQWGGVDIRNPRIEVTLSNIQPVEEDRTMQIILTQQEIEDAIRETVLQQITIREDQGIAVAFQGLTKEGSLSVNITIQKVNEDTAPKKVRTRKPIQIEESIQDEPTKVHVVEGETVKGKLDLSQPIAASPMPVFTTAPKIFPDINSSAPVSEQATAISQPTLGKSLFANLTKPVHDSPSTPSKE